MSTQDTALDGHFRALDAALKSVAAAGAVITKDVEPYAIAGGVPAKRIGERRAI